MVITPNSKVKLLKCPLKLDQNNEMTFASATAQFNYFNSLPKLEYDNLTYIRKDGVLRIETDDDNTTTGLVTYEDLLGYNFCMYQNTHFKDKWFYAYITEVNWINPSLTELKIETAYFQTWQFDLVYKDSYIEREHVNDDTRGKNLVAENIPVDEYIIDQSRENVFFNKNTFVPVFAVTEIARHNGMQNIPFVSIQGNVFAGMCYIVPMGNGTADALVRLYDEQGHADSIKYMFMCPSELVEISDYVYAGYLADGTTPYVYGVIDNNTSYNVNTGLYDKPTTLDTYQPKNNKMLQFPYCFLSIDAHNGNVYNYNYEDINANKYSLECDAMLSVGCSIKYIVPMYKVNSASSMGHYTYGFTGIKFPPCAWVSDTYTNWLTQNAVNQGINMLTGITNVVGGLFTANISQVQGGISGILGTMATDHKASMQADQVRGNENAGDINFAIGLVNPIMNEMSIKRGQAKIIDDFFTMFGYKVNRLGTPHIHARTYFDYIKTIDVNLEGNIPEHDLNEIKKMFDNGIRFWHDTTKFLDFSVTNSIIT